MITQQKFLDRLATRSTTTITKTTPQASLEIMIDLLPIELMIQKTGLAAYLRLRNQLTPFANTDKHKSHLKYWDDLIKQQNIQIPITDKCQSRVWEKSYNVNLESLNGKSKHTQHSEFTIYTDGSKKKEGTGGGFCII